MDAPLLDLLSTAFRGGASDLFLAEGQRPRVRQDGEIITTHGEPQSRDQIAAIWRSCGIDPEQENDGDVSLAVDGIGRLRLNAYRTLGRLAVVMRPIKSEIPSFEDLGLPGDILARWIERRSGLILVCGPTGSGKSTTVAACLEWINRHQARHVVTLEDPIEYLFTNDRSYFSQREIDRDTGDFNHAVRQALRQNPDVIFFGEIRDAASALSALRAAETGHLVISTLHAAGVSGVPAAIERLTRLLGSTMAGTPYLLATQLIGVMAQQLLPRIDGGLVPMLEYFENVGVTRRWIGESEVSELRDHVDKGDARTACSFLRYLVSATRQDIIAADIARAACDRPQDFDRAMRGIS